MSNLVEELSNIKKSPHQENVNVNNNITKTFSRKENKLSSNSESKDNISDEVKIKIFKNIPRKERKDKNILNNSIKEKEKDYQKKKDLENLEKFKDKNVLPIRSENKNIPRIYKRQNSFSVNYNIIYHFIKI